MTELTAPMRRALPDPRGPLSAAVIHVLGSGNGSDEPPHLAGLARRTAAADEGVLGSDDAQLTLMVLYELHYRGWCGVHDDWEWNPVLLGVASALERRMITELKQLAGRRYGPFEVHPDEVPAALAALVTVEVGPSLSSYLARQASTAQYAEFLVHRSIYHLKEADPHTWTIPRLTGDAKAALVEVQSDEYGGGRPERMHAALFARAMRGLGLDDGYGRYLDDVPAVTLAWANTMTLFGLHRRHRGAAAGHLAALEMTSSLPNRRYGNGLRRLGFGPGTTRFFDEHVEADAVHEQIACHDLAGQLAAREPELAGDILFGAAAAMLTDASVGAHLMSRWQAGEVLVVPAAVPVPG